MNHAKMTLTITAIVAAAALASVAFAVPQQVMAGGHRHHNSNNHNGIKVDQQVNQLNQCSGQQEQMDASWILSTPPGSTTCVNIGANSANIGHH